MLLVRQLVWGSQLMMLGDPETALCCRWFRADAPRKAAWVGLTSGCLKPLLCCNTPAVVNMAGMPYYFSLPQILFEASWLGSACMMQTVTAFGAGS